MEAPERPTLKCQPILDTLESAVKSYGLSLVRQSGYVYQFIIKDAGPEGQIALDLKHGTGEMKRGIDPNADVTITIMDEDLVKMAHGHLSHSNAMDKGRLEIEGDSLAGYVLGDVLDLIKRREANGGQSYETVSDETTRRWRIGTVVVIIVVFVYLFFVQRPRAAKSGGGPRELEKIAHMPQAKLAKIANGVVNKLQGFSSQAFRQMVGDKTLTDFDSRPTDVFIVGTMGSGTTWLSQVLHGLRSNGNMGFGEITEVVPWIDASGSQAGKETLAGQEGYVPRLFKSHRLCSHLPRGLHYVVLVRDPMQVMLSQYRLFGNGTWGQMAGLTPGELPLALFAAGVFARSNANEVWKHLASWYECCWHDQQAIWVTYEDLLADPAWQIRRLAKFLLPGLPGHDVMKKVEKQASRQFMLEHVSQFDNHLLLERLEIFKGAAKQGAALSMPRVLPESPYAEVPYPVEMLFQARWERLVEPVVGFESYDAMRTAIQGRAAPAYGAVGSSAPQTWGLLRFTGMMLLAMALVAAAISLGPRSWRSTAVRLLIVVRARWRRALSKVLDSKKEDDREDGNRPSGFTV